MLTPERKAAVDALSDDELAYEIQRGRASRFQRELYDYAVVQHEQRQQAKADAAQQVTLQVAQEGLSASKSQARHTLIAWVVAAVLGAVTLYLTFRGK